MMKKEYVTCPITNFSTIKEILFILENENNLKIKTLVEFTKKSVSAINNALPLMREMNLIRTSNKATKLGQHADIVLMINGRKLANYLKATDKEKIKEIAQNELLSKSKILSESYKILKDEPDISSEKLGRLLNSKLEKSTKWKHDLTYRNVGRTCIYILDGLELINYKGGSSRRGRKFRGKQRNVLLPYITADKIFELLEKFKEENTWYITTSNYNSNEKFRIFGYASTLIDLGIAQYSDLKNNILQLTQDGIKLKESITNEHNRKENFKDILLKNHHLVEIIKRIKNLNKDVGYLDVGEIIEKYNDVNWAHLTKRGYGIKVLNWLKEADILEENSEYGKYHISPTFIEKHSTIFVNFESYGESNIQKMLPISIDVDTAFMNLYRFCDWIIYSENDEWYDNNTIKTDIIENLDKMIKFSKDKDTIITQDAKYWIEQGYETKNIKYIKHCLELIVKIDKINKIST